MSNRAIDAVKDFSRSKGSERLLLFMLADGASKETGLYRAKISTLMAECNMTERWIQKLIPRLIALGELVVINNPGYSSEFAIPIYEGEEGYDPQPCTDEYHDCSRFHTPLSVVRDSIRREEWNAKRLEHKRSQRKTTARKGVNDSTPLSPDSPPKAYGVNDSTPPGEREYTPGVNDSTPGGEREDTTSTLSLTPVITLMSTDARSRVHHPHLEKEKEATQNERNVATAPDAPAPPSPPPPLLWPQIIQRLKAGGLSQAELGSWIIPMQLDALSRTPEGGAVACFTVPNTGHSDVVKLRYAYLLSAAVAAHLKISSHAVELQFQRRQPNGKQVTA